MTGDRPPVTPFTRWEHLQHSWIRHHWMDWLLAALVVVAWLALGKLWLPWALTEVPPDARRTTYQILAAAAATMGGFTLTSISILINLLRTPMSAVDKLLPTEDKRRVGAAFLSTLPTLVALFVAALIALITDANVTVGYWWLQAIVVAAALAAVLALARVGWILRRLLALS